MTARGEKSTICRTFKVLKATSCLMPSKASIIYRGERWKQPHVSEETTWRIHFPIMFEGTAAYVLKLVDSIYRSKAGSAFLAVDHEYRSFTEAFVKHKYQSAILSCLAHTPFKALSRLPVKGTSPYKMTSTINISYLRMSKVIIVSCVYRWWIIG